MALPTDVAKFNTLLNESHKDPNDLQAHFRLLAHINTYRLPYPQLVIQYGQQLIDAYNPKTTLLVSPFSFWASMWNLISPDPIREHIFDIIEQTCLAAVACHSYAPRNECLYLLEFFFKDSIRVLFLRGQIYESAERYEEAMAIYRTIIHQNRHAGYVLRAKQRLIAINKEFGRYTQVLTDLNTFTMMYSDCYDGWFELYQVSMLMGAQNNGKYTQGAILAASHLLLLEPDSYMSYNYNGDALMSYADSSASVKCGLAKWWKGDKTNDWGEKSALWDKMKKFRASAPAASATTTPPLDPELSEALPSDHSSELNTCHQHDTTTQPQTQQQPHKHTKSTKPSNKQSQQPLDDDIKIIYDHLLNARYYYSTSFHLNPNQIAAVGLVTSSSRIKWLLEQYPTLIHCSSTKPEPDLASSASGSTQQNQAKNGKAQDKRTHQQELLDCIDLMQIGTAFLTKKAAKRCVEQMKITFANQKRQERGVEQLPPILTIDPFSVAYLYQRDGVNMKEEGNGLLQQIQSDPHADDATVLPKGKDPKAKKQD